MREVNVGDHFGLLNPFQALLRLFHCWRDVRHMDRMVGLVYYARNLDDLPNKLLSGGLVVELISCTRHIHKHIFAVARLNDFPDTVPLGVLLRLILRTTCIFQVICLI